MLAWSSALTTSDSDSDPSGRSGTKRICVASRSTYTCSSTSESYEVARHCLVKVRQRHVGPEPAGACSSTETGIPSGRKRSGCATLRIIAIHTL